MSSFNFRTISVFFSVFLLSITLIAQEGKYVTSSDGFVKVKIPGDWKEMQLNDAANLQYGNEEKGIYFMIIDDAKQDIDGWNLKKHSFITLAKLLEGVTSPVIEGPKTIIAGKQEGIQYSIKGSVQGQMIIYLHTTFETDHTFSQVLTWTIPSQFDKNKETMSMVISSFLSAK